MIAESAVIGRLNGCIGMAISTITTLLDGAVSLTQMNLSDSMVTWVKEMNCWLTPSVVNCKIGKAAQSNMNSHSRSTQPSTFHNKSPTPRASQT